MHRVVIILTILYLCPACSSIYSPSKIPDYALTTELYERKQFHLRSSAQQNHKPSVIGHGAGDFRYYPMNLSVSQRGVTKGVRGNNWPTKTAWARPVSELIEKAYESYQLDGVEIDVQIPPAGHPLCVGLDNKCAFVMHDEPNWSAITPNTEAFNYMRQNSLGAVLNDYISQKYIDKALYLEVKASKPCQSLPPLDSHDCLRAPQMIYAVIEPFITSNSNQQKGWLRFVSFSPGSLQALQTLSLQLDNETREQLNFALIAGYRKDSSWIMNLLRKNLSQMKGPVPEFSDDVIHFAAHSEWLDMLWFSPKGADYPDEMIRLVDEKRNQANLPPLQYSVSIYDTDKASFEQKMKSFPVELESILIDIDRKH